MTKSTLLVLFTALLSLSAVRSFIPAGSRMQRANVLLKRTTGVSVRASVTPGETSNGPQSPTQASVAGFSKSVAGPVALAAFFGAISPLLTAAAAANADDTATTAPAVEPKADLGPPPTDFTLKNDYYADCQQVVNHMRYAVQLEKGNPVLPEVAKKTKEEMNEFVAYYRRFQGLSGRQSFSLLYTSINVLAGHYTSYGVKFPVPEKRRKRLLQEFNDIEKNIRKKR